MMQSNLNSPVAVIKSSAGKRTININITSNPQTFNCNQDIPGLAVGAVITSVTMTMAGGAVKPEVCQVDFGNAIHVNANTTFGCMPSCIQCPVAAKVSVPVAFFANKVPQNMKVAVYGPGDPGTLLNLDATVGCHLQIQYHYRAQ